MLNFLKAISKFLSFLLPACLIGSFVSCHYRALPPKMTHKAQEVDNDPVQTPTSRKPFTFSYKGTSYQVDPVFDYDISGIIVSHNDITAFGDIYHDDKSVDTKDLCLLWGDNLAASTLSQSRFHNESVSCHVDRAPEDFRADQFSNNHLVTNSDSVRRDIDRVEVGDQVQIKGMLVNYYPAGMPDYSRNSSTTRTDTAGGACEVVFVNSIRTLVHGDHKWITRYTIFIGLFFWGLVIRFILFCVIPYIEYKAINIERTKK